MHLNNLILVDIYPKQIGYLLNLMLRLQQKMPSARVALTVHDEIIIIAANTHADATMESIIDDLCIAPEWAPDLPLAAEGGYDTVYSK